MNKYGQKVMEMKEEERPRYRALKYGFDVLSNEEILAIILQSGSAKFPVFDLAKAVLQKSENLSRLFDLNVNELMEIPGIKEAKALNIMASVELCKRVLRQYSYGIEIQTPKDIFNWFQYEVGFDKQEVFVVIFLDIRDRIITHKTMFKGTLTESCVHPRDIFKEAFLQNAYSIICVHNHPSGDTTPSIADIYLTNQLEAVGKTMGVEMRDHVIVGRNSWYSFQQERYLD